MTRYRTILTGSCAVVALLTLGSSARYPHPAAEPAPASQVTTVQKSIALEEEVRRVLLDTVVAKTGYPEDMLEMNLDLE